MRASALQILKVKKKEEKKNKQKEKKKCKEKKKERKRLEEAELIRVGAKLRKTIPTMTVSD